MTIKKIKACMSIDEEDKPTVVDAEAFHKVLELCSREVNPKSPEQRKVRLKHELKRREEARRLIKNDDSGLTFISPDEFFERQPG